MESYDPFGPRSQASLQKAQGPGMCTLPKPPASRALCQAKRAPRAAFPSGCLAAQTKRWAEGIWLCDPMDCSPSGSSVHGTFQARILEKVAVPSPRGSSLESHRVPQIHVREPHWEMVSADVTSEDGVTLGRVALNAVTHVHVRRGERQRQGCGLCRGHLRLRKLQETQRGQGTSPVHTFTLDSGL